MEPMRFHWFWLDLSLETIGFDKIEVLKSHESHQIPLAHGYRKLTCGLQIPVQGEGDDFYKEFWIKKWISALVVD